MWRHMSGAGNTFIVADRRHETSLLSTSEARECITSHPRPDLTAIEGLLTINKTTTGHIVGTYYNPDGSRGMMCGNGARCLVRMAMDLDPTIGFTDVQLTLNDVAYNVERIDTNKIAITFGPPRRVQRYDVGELDNVDVLATYIDVNSDHVVIDGPLDAHRPIVQVLRHHAAFPRGVNVNMVDRISDSTWRIATFERGVEAITGACGTGAIASAIALYLEGRTTVDTNFIPPSGRPLHVSLTATDSTIHGAILTGDTQYDF